tara:strand:+ start:2330 stop:3199 length:870 start_codon:yes stop_codon:yes gene_type:complete
MKPNFFIVGGSKCGTTNMSYYLNEHENVFIPEHMEPYYYSRFDISKDFQRQSMITDEKNYLKLFKNAKNGQAIGESSPVYLQCPHAPIEIKKDNPDAKIIISIRNPIDKAHSSYFSYKFMNNDERSFSEKIDLFQNQCSSNEFFIFNFIEDGLFSKHIKRFQSNFSSEQIKIIFFEEYIKNTPQHIKSIFEFLDIDSEINLKSQPKNSFRVPKNRVANSLLKNQKFRKISEKLVPNVYRNRIGEKFFVKQSTKPAMNSDDRLRLKQIFEPEFESLSNLLDRKLPWKDFI